MRTHWRACPRPAVSPLRQLFVVAILACGFIPQSITAQTADPQETPMQHFALLFRASRTTFSEQEQKQRALEIQAWVKHVTGMGIALEPKALGHFTLRLSEKDSAILAQQDPADPALVNFVFFDAPTEEQAIEVARSHPGLHYGVSVELRDYTIPGRTTNSK